MAKEVSSYLYYSSFTVNLIRPFYDVLWFVPNCINLVVSPWGTGSYQYLAYQKCIASTLFLQSIIIDFWSCFLSFCHRMNCGDGDFVWRGSWCFRYGTNITRLKETIQYCLNPQWKPVSVVPSSSGRPSFWDLFIILVSFTVILIRPCYDAFRTYDTSS